MDGRAAEYGRTASHQPSGPARNTSRAIRRRRRAVHLWVPACLSGLLLVGFFPLILRLQPGRYRAATGHSPGPYLVRWLLLTAGMFLVSGLVYGLGAIRRHRGNMDDQAKRLSG